MNLKQFAIAAGAILGLTFLVSGNAEATLTVTPLTWNIIGLDSNNPTSGPKYFPVGARVCSSVATTNVAVNFVWDSANANINLRPGSLSAIAIPSLGVGACSDAYFETEVTQVAAAYDTTRKYHITATDSSGTASTPTPRELYVEHLVSQNRNGITDIKLNGTSVAAGGSMTLMVGNTYTIELDGFTATQGYNQLESFINFPNTIFQLQSVSTAYTADTSPYVPNPNSKLYADACLWDNDPGSPTYRSCVGGDYKAGGTVAVTYTVRILSGAGTSQTLSNLFYDFSGSSYHYNADYGVSYRIANIVDPSSVTISKIFTPKAIAPGDTSVMSFKLTNPTTETFTGVNFSDSVPSGLVVAATPGVTYSGCGSGAFSPALTGGATSLSFANGTLSANSICTITVNVTAASAGTYVNTTGHLFINTSTDTGNTGTDTLAVSSAAACTPGQTLATWTFETAAGTGVPPLYTTKASNVSTATTSYTAGGTGGAQSVNTTLGSPAVNSWEGSGFQKSVVYTSTTAPYFDIAVDTSNYSNASISLLSYATANWGTANILRVWSSADGGTSFSSTTPATGSLTKTTWSADQTFAAASTGASTTIFRINADGANPSGASMLLDNIVVTGCSVPTPAPAIAKSFSSPIVKGSNSTLSFTITNTAAGNQALTGIAFTDVLPAGLSIADSSTTQCSGTLTTTAATRTIALTGGSLAAGGSCTFNVTVAGTTQGQYDNVTGYISSTQSGASTNYATASLTVIAPPAIAKSFSPTSIFTGNTSTLSFTITNPNSSNSLSGIGFTDTLPAGLSAPNGTTSSLCGSGSLAITGGNLLTFSGASFAANSSCTFSVTVTDTTAGTKNNTTSAVTSTEAGNGNTASGSLVVNDQTASIDLTKQVSATGADPWTSFIGVAAGFNVYYLFKVYNSGDLSFTAISVSDPALAGTPADPASCNWTASLPLAPGATATCVTGPVAAVTGSHANTATAQGIHASGTITSSPSTATYATTGLTIAKSVTETYFTAAGNQLHYSYLVTNSGSAALAGPVSVTDNLTTVTCPALSSVGNFDNWFNPGESITCTATYTVTSADVTAKLVTNTAFATVDGVTSPTDSKTVPLAPDLTVAKSNNAGGSVALGSAFVWTLTMSNSASAGSAASFSNTQTLLTDDLPATGATYNLGAVTTAGGTSGTINCAIATNTLTCTASGTVTIPPGGSFSVPITVTPSAGGSLVNPRSSGICAADPLGVISEINETSNSCSDTVTVTGGAVADLAITKTDGVTSVNAGGSTTYTITVTNNGPGDVTGATVVDTAPAGLMIGAWTCAVTTAGTGSVTTACGAASGSGNLNTTVTMRNGAAITYTVAATVSGSATGTIANTATVSVPAGVSDPTPGNNSATDTDTINAGTGMISGSVWYDLNYNSIRDGSEVGRAGWPVQLMSGGLVISTTTTDSGGQYAFTGLPDGIYTVRFIDPIGQMLTNGPLPVNGDGGSAVSGGGTPTLSQLSGITLGAGITSVPGQSLPIDPSGVVYNSVTRLAIGGALVTLGGPPGFNPAIHLAGGLATLTTGADGAFAFFFLPAAPAGTYTLTVSRAGYAFVSTVIPPTTVPAGFTGGNVSGQAVAGPPAGPTSTTYYLSFPLPATDITNNNIPLDAAAIVSSSTAIPTFTEWGLVALSLMLLLLGGASLRRRQ